MSTIGPVDIKDWELKIYGAKLAIEDIEEDNNKEGCLKFLTVFVNEVEKLLDSQQQVAALFLPVKKE